MKLLSFPPVAGKGVLARSALVLLGASLVACAPALNYLEPVGPSHESRYAATAPSLPRVVEEAPLRVVTFNIAHARRVDRALEVLREAPPLQSADVLLLQEMDGASVERIARTLGLNSVYVPSAVHPRSDRDFGCALLSPWPIVEPRKLLLPHADPLTRLRRAVVVATLLRGDQRVRVYGVHLSVPLGLSGGARREQVKVLLDDAKASPDPVVIAGDFNSHDIGERLVEAGYSWITREVGGTLRFLFFGLSYDHVFARGLDPVRNGPACGAVEDNGGASDHRPVWAVLVPEPVPAGTDGRARP